MLQYWRKNKRSFYGFMVIGLVIFLISLIHLKDSLRPLGTQLAYNFLISFSILFVLYAILFTVSFLRFKKLVGIFSQHPFNNLPRTTYKVEEVSSRHILFLTGLTITGSSNDYPVRIEYDNNQIIIVVGIGDSYRNLKPLLDAEGLSVNDLGVIKKLNRKDVLAKKDGFALNEEIDRITGFLQKNAIGKFQFT